MDLKIIFSFALFFIHSISLVSPCRSVPRKCSTSECEDKLINEFLDLARTTTVKPVTTTQSFLAKFPRVNEWPRLKLFPSDDHLKKQIKQKTDIDKARRVPIPPCENC